MKTFSIANIVELLVLPVLTAGVLILWDLNKSVAALNVQVGVLIANGANADDKIKALEKRVEKLEESKRQ